MATPSSNQVTAKAHTNIALVKYWGKKDEDLIIPQTGSLSLTLDHFYTETTVSFSKGLKTDTIKIDNQLVNQKNWQKIHSFLNIVRKKAHINLPAEVSSFNHVPYAAGLASSASAFAALAAASSRAAGLSLNKKQLSQLARRGSGSACRSIFGGFVEWIGGQDDESSYAMPLKSDLINDIRIVALTIKASPKKFSSRKAMRLSVQTSPYYKSWIQLVKHDLAAVKITLLNNDFSTLGHISELNAMRMHALTMSSDPSILYFNEATLRIINSVKQLREKGIECYYTIDAGPNVKIICKEKNVSIISKYFEKIFDKNRVIVAKPGSGVTYE